MAFETADFVAEGNFPLKEKWTKYSKLFSPPSFNSVHIPQSLEITDAKISLRKSAIKSYFLLGQQFKNPTCGSNRSSDIDFFFFMAQNTQLFSEKKKFTRQLTNVLIPTNTIFNMFSVHSIFFFLLNILLRTVLWQFVNTPLMTKAQGK